MRQKCNGVTAIVGVDQLRHYEYGGVCSSNERTPLCFVYLVGAIPGWTTNPRVPVSRRSTPKSIDTRSLILELCRLVGSVIDGGMRLGYSYDVVDHRREVGHKILDPV